MEFKPFHEHSLEKGLKVIRNGSLSHLITSRYAAPLMIERKKGFIVEVTDGIGYELRTFNFYSPNHVYEHTYLSSERYCWQNLVGVQRGHGDVDLATTYKFDEDLYLFTFREFIIPVASVFFYNMRQLRSTGKFLGVASTGEIENSPSGAFIQKASMTFYPKDIQPV